MSFIRNPLTNLALLALLLYVKKMALYVHVCIQPRTASNCAEIVIVRRREWNYTRGMRLLDYLCVSAGVVVLSICLLSTYRERIRHPPQRAEGHGYGPQRWPQGKELPLLQRELCGHSRHCCESRVVCITTPPSHLPLLSATCIHCTSPPSIVRLLSVPYWARWFLTVYIVYFAGSH